MHSIEVPGKVFGKAQTAVFLYPLGRLTRDFLLFNIHKVVLLETKHE
jgi:hypothetical protein